MYDNFKKAFLLILFLIFISSCSCVYSYDLNQTNSSNDLSFNDTSTLSKSYKLNGGSFDDIQDIVDNAKSGDTLKLEGNFKSKGTAIVIDKKLNIISSNGAILDANGKSRIFNIKSSAKGLMISNILFQNAFSQKRGGAVYLNASNVVFDNCAFKNCQALSGGAIATPINTTHANNLIIKNSIFYSNHVSSTAGAVYYIAKNLKMISCIFDSNYIQLEEDGWCGGVMQIGFENQNNNAEITNCTFNNNYVIPHSSNNGHAGVACLRRGVTFNDCVFTNNNAYDAGVLCFHDGGSVINCEFYNNQATGYGGAITFYNTTQKIHISQSLFQNNSARYGGAIMMVGCDNVEINGSIFINNTASNYGGALWIINSNIDIKNSMFIFNSAINGSAIYNEATLNIQDSIFEDNKAKSYKLLISYNDTIKKGEALIITVTLIVGDNVIDAIHTKDENIEIDNQKISQSNLAKNQRIILVLDNKVYFKNTNDKGIAKFVIDTSKLNLSNYTCFISYLESFLYTGINDTILIKIIENSKSSKDSKRNEMLKSSDDYVNVRPNLNDYLYDKGYSNLKEYMDDKGYSNLNELIVENTPKYHMDVIDDKYKNDDLVLNYIKKMIEINSPKCYENPDFIAQIIQFIPLSPFFYYFNGKLYDGYLKTNGDFWKIMDEPFIQFYGYRSNIGDNEVVANLVDVLIGIDSNGDMSIGDAILNIASIFIGAGIGRIGVRILYSLDFLRVIKSYFLYKQFFKYSLIVKDIFFDAFNVLYNPFNVINVVIGRLGNKLIDSNDYFKFFYLFFYNDVRNCFNLINPNNWQDAINNFCNGLNKSLSNGYIYFKNVVNNMNNIFINIKSYSSSLIKKMVFGACKLFNNVKSNMKDIVSKVKSKVKSLFNNVRSKVKGVVSKVRSKVKGVVSKVRNSSNKARNIFNASVSKFKTSFSKAKHTMKKGTNKIKQCFSKIVNKISNFLHIKSR